MAAIKTLETLQQVTSAFDKFVTVQGSNLPDYYKEVFPSHCDCGAEVIMTWDEDEQSGYTQLQCCDPDCWVKMAHRFAYFAKTLGFKGFGAAGALPLYKELHTLFEYPTFLYIFKLPLVEIQAINGDAYARDFSAMYDDIHNNVWQFKDAIAALGIPDIGKNCSLFDVVKDPTTFLSFVLKKRLPELCSMAGIYAEKTYYYLDMARVDIVTLMSEIMPHIASTPKKEIYVAITGSVTVDSTALTRAEFIWKCEGLKDADGRQAYKIVETRAESKLDYVIADAPSSTSKYMLGQRLNKLITAQEFYDILRQNAGGQKDE